MNRFTNVFGHRRGLEPVNLNPLSSKGGLDALSFFATLALLCGALLFFGELMPKLIARPRLAGDFDKTLRFYGIWLAGSSVGFWLVTSAFVKRWAWILGKRDAPGFVRTILRFSLLSPLLGMFLTGLTLIISNRGPVRERAEPVMTYLLALAAFGLFHTGFLLYRVNTGELVRDGVTLRLSDRRALAAESLESAFPEFKAPKGFPNEFAQIHIAPYLTPALKFSLALYTDYRRASVLFEHASENDPAVCRVNETYLGVKVENCFYEAYQKADATHAFASPIFGLLYETQYRQKFQGKTPESVLMALKNLVSFVDPANAGEGRAAFLHPIGLLRYFASPELPILELGQQLQTRILIEKLAPVINSETQKLDAVLKPVSTQPGGEAFAPLLKEVAALKVRAAALQLHRN